MGTYESTPEQFTSTCPVCGNRGPFYKYAVDIDHALQGVRRDAARPGDAIAWNFAVLRCPIASCFAPVVRVTEHRLAEDGRSTRQEQHVVYPLDHGQPPAPGEVPPEVRVDYDEACSVLPLSAKASAALSRRLLERVLENPGGFKEEGL